jgi:hypothetical protein
MKWMGYVAPKEVVQSEHKIISVKSEPLGKRDRTGKVSLKRILKKKYICLSMALQPFVGPWPPFQFLDLLHSL